MGFIAAGDTDEFVENVVRWFTPVFTTDQCKLTYTLKNSPVFNVLICNISPLRCPKKNTRWFNLRPVYGSFYCTVVVPRRRPATASFFSGNLPDEQETGCDASLAGHTGKKILDKLISKTPKQHQRSRPNQNTMVSRRANLKAYSPIVHGNSAQMYKVK